MDRLLWPVSNWLWANIVNPLVAGTLQLTPRRVVYLAFFTAFAFAFVYAAAELAQPHDDDAAVGERSWHGGLR